MEIEILGRDDGITHVALSGRFDATSAEEFDKSFSEATAERKQSVIIDLSAIEFIASRGIGILITKSKELKIDGHRMVLLNPQELVDAVFKTSMMDKVVPIAYELDEAMRILGRATGKAPATTPQPKAAIDDVVAQQPAVAVPAAEQVLNVVIRNELSELDVLNRSLHRFLDAHSVPSRAAYAVDLAIEELIVNVIRYAYVDDDEHSINVELALEGDELVLRIEDDGRPFDPREGPEFNPHAEDREAGGLGLILVLDMVDALKYQRVQESNRVEVRVYLAATEENGELTGAADVP
jgi:serine/threonine-protein kinase RsbW